MNWFIPLIFVAIGFLVIVGFGLALNKHDASASRSECGTFTSGDGANQNEDHTDTSGDGANQNEDHTEADGHLIFTSLVDQWKYRDSRFWDSISKLFYAQLLLLVLPVLPNLFNNSIQEELTNIIKNNQLWFQIGYFLLALAYLFIGILYSARISAVKRSFDYMMEKTFHFHRVTNRDLTKNGYAKAILNFPVNFGLICIYFFILLFAQFIVFSCICSM